MANPGLIKSLVAETAIAAFTIVKYGSTDGSAAQATSATDKLMGATNIVAAAIGDRIDVVMDESTEITLGGTVTRGDPLTSDASGRAVTAAPAAGSNNRIIGFAMVSGVVGDVVPVRLAPHMMQG